MEPALRVANVDDETAVQVLMTESAAVLFPRFYDERQAASAVQYVAQVDRVLLEDGTYYVIESEGELIACGGWSESIEEYEVAMPDGVTIPCVSMELPIGV
jgi:hypothetical protein